MSKKRVDELVESAREPLKDAVDSAAKPMKSAARPVISAFQSFVQIQASGGIVLILAAIAALTLANSPVSSLYNEFFATHIEVRWGDAKIDRSLLHWVNDGLMAVFFLLVGLEVKRELMEGELRGLDQVVLPAVAAVGGMAVPAAIYLGLNFTDPAQAAGWAIPAATDIAFALGVISLLGNRVPNALKVFLLAIAIFDDIGAIVVIAVFFSDRLVEIPLYVAGLCIVSLIVTNLLGVRRVAVYVLLGIVLWVAVLKSGVHATLAGVITGLAIPIAEKDGTSPLNRLEEMLHPWVAFAIVPLFAVANAGVPLRDVTADVLIQPVTLGIILGLLVGKPLGIALMTTLAVRCGLAQLPDRITWPMILGAGMLAGIGFTMSLFIASLALGGSDFVVEARLGVLVSSALAAVIGLVMLFLATRNVGDSNEA